MHEQTGVVIADQLIYTRVEADYSPIGKSGFQTVYHSGLSQVVVDAIEQRVRCFDPYKEQAVRLQFFTACQNKVVLTRTISIPTDPVIVDRSYRPGAFLVHCLVLDVYDFREKLQNDPFVLFNSFDFIDSATQMVERFGELPAFIPNVPWEYPKEGRNIFSIDAIDAISLVLYLLSFDSGKNTALPVLLPVGSGEEIELLKLVFKLLPSDKRLDCLFDTQINHCSIQTDWYKVVCESPDSSGSTVKHIKQSQIAAKKYSAHELKSIYAEWLSYINDSNKQKQQKVSKLIQKAESIQQVDITLRKGGVCDLEALSQQAIREIRDARYALIKEILADRVSAALNKNLSRLIMPYILKTNSVKQLINVSITQTIDDSSFHTAIVKFLNDQDTELANEDWLAIKNFSEKTNNMYLLFLASTLSRRVDKRSRDKALKLMSKSEYRQLLKDKLGNPISPVHFVEESRLPILLHKDIINSMTDSDIIELIAQLIHIKAEAHTLTFITRIEEFDLESIQKLEKITRRRKNIPPKVSLVIKHTKSQARTNAPRRFWYFPYQ